MIPIVIRGNKYFLRWTLADCRRLEQLCGNLSTVCSIHNATYKNLVGLVWTGLYEDNFRGEQEHVFHQQMHGFKAAQAMVDIIAEEHPGKYDAQSFMFVHAYKAMEESGWFTAPSQTATRGSVVASETSDSELPKFFYETYQNAVKSVAYGLLHLTPQALDTLTPAEVMVMGAEVVEYEKSKRTELDILMATVKQVLFATTGNQVKVQEMMVWNVDAPTESGDDNEQTVSVFKQWVKVTDGQTI